MTPIKKLSAKEVVRDVLIIFALSAIAGFYTSLAMPGKYGTPEHSSMVALLSLVLSTVGFTIVACLSPNNRWRQLVFVVVLTWLLGGLVNIPFFGLSFLNWLKGAVHVVITAVIGGAFSYVIKGARPSPT
jgi:cell division protein FtsW (lipid II flippase)